MKKLKRIKDNPNDCFPDHAPNINKSLIFDTLWVLGLIPYTQNFPPLGLLLLIFSKNCF